MKARSATPMRVAKMGYIVISIILCAIGLFFIVRPDTSLVAIGRLLGIVMIAFGAVKLVGYFSRDLFRLAFQYDREFGVLILVLGVATLLHPTALMNFLFIAWGVAILADGLFKARIAFDSKEFGIKRWWIIMTLSMCAMILGVALILRPVEGAVVLGVSLFAEGALNLYVAIATVKIIDNQYPDVIDAEYTEMEYQANEGSGR